MKKKVLLSSVATIALCLCLIAGSTFALFTDTTEFNIAVTSGDVEIEAYAKVNSVYSARGANKADDKFLVDENGHTYTHEKQQEHVFLNGGTAKVDGKNLVIDRITPGDKVDVDINITNKSNVSFVYRYKLVSNNSNLATGMVVTVDGKSYEGLAIWTSEWYPVIATSNGEPLGVPVKTISVELPVYAGNEYQSEHTEGKVESVTYTIIVEAVQGNAVTKDESEVVLYQTKPVLSANFVQSEYQGDIFDNPISNAVVVKDLYLKGKASVAVDAKYGTVVLENVTADVEGNLINSQYFNTYILSDCEIILDGGEKILEVPSQYTAHQIILHNVYVVTGGERVLITEANVSRYITVDLSHNTVWVYND